MLPVVVRLDLELSEGLNLRWPDLAAGVRVDEQALQGLGGDTKVSRYQESIQNLIKGKKEDKS
jgi:hypothetical protein